MEDLDIQVALQCAPSLTDIKISNLLAVGRSKGTAALGLFRETAASRYILYESSGKTTFLLYIKSALETYLSRPEVKALIERFGYRRWDLEEILSLVSIKYEKHTRDCVGFPHEASLLLNYPVKDVTGFIENNGKNFLCIGYQKVYSNLSECKHTFQSYSHTREHTIRMVLRGVKIGAILRIHNLNRHKSMTM